jgi:hypothetical protein
MNALSLLLNVTPFGVNGDDGVMICNGINDGDGPIGIDVNDKRKQQ